MVNQSIKISGLILLLFVVGLNMVIHPILVINNILELTLLPTLVKFPKIPKIQHSPLDIYYDTSIDYHGHQYAIQKYYDRKTLEYTRKLLN